ncbi:hypothetical protein CY35_14G086500 [Sphagnum magellanicum]|nr:hypothetical protein CY35_14G086500 [Sphagnum magellanicum]KAH9541836.1 hypothetical protein CY35_14G086500 [Sphagnum magellanicum]
MLQSGRTYEREDIKRWFDAGHKTDPVTKEELSDLSMHPNVPLRQSIVEWVERNYCLSIRHAKHMIETGNEAKQRTGFAKLQSLCEENRVNKGWIVAEDGLLSTIVGVLKSQSREIKRDALLTLFMIVKNHVSNKEMVAEVGGVEQIVRCLARDMSVARPAVVLLHELAQDGKGGSITSVRVKLESDRSAILCLVTLATGRDPEAATSARFVLQPLSDRDENVIQMAKANWFPPLIARLREGSAASKLAMAKVVAEMELTADGKQKMVEQGAVALLVNISMEKSNVEVTAAALGALDRLSFMSQSQSYFVDAGTVPAVLHHLFAGWSHPNIQEIAASILKNLAAEDGIDYFLDSSGAPLELELHIQNLLSMQESMVCSHVVQKHLLGALLGMAAKPNAVKVRTLIRTQQGIPRLLSIIRRVEKDTRDCIIHLLWHLSDEGGTQIAALMHGQQLADDFVLWLKERGKDNIQVAAAGILANLPLEDEVLTRSLVDAGVLSELVSVLQSRNEKAQESAISALMRFTDASNIEIQQALLLVHCWQPCFVLKSPFMIWSSSDGSKVFGDVIIPGCCDNVPTHKGTTLQHGDVGLTTVAAQLSWKKVLESQKEACQNAVWHNLFIPQQNVQDLMQST